MPLPILKKPLQGLCLILLSGTLWAASVQPVISEQTAPEIIRVRQGEAFSLTLSLPKQSASPRARFRDKTIPLFQLSPRGTYGALIGIDLEERPFRYELVVEGADPSMRFIVEVIPVSFGIQELTLPQEQVVLDEATLKRVRKEQQEILESMSPVTEERLWEGRFIKPVEGQMAGSFGLKRILNGEPRSPHSGEDFKAPAGTAVRASNTGRVVLAGDYFFSGRSVIIDHGVGCYTMYFHLQNIDVKMGDLVKKGMVIGSVGSTGRATGPHLHWGVRINGARVNPVSMVDMEGSIFGVEP